MCIVAKKIKKELSTKLSKLGAVKRIGTLILIRPSFQLGPQRFPKEDQEKISNWVLSNGYLDASGKPFERMDYRFKQAFYIKL